MKLINVIKSNPFAVILVVIAAVVALFVFMILFIWLGTKIMRGVND